MPINIGGGDTIGGGGGGGSPAEIASGRAAQRGSVSGFRLRTATSADIPIQVDYFTKREFDRDEANRVIDSLVRQFAPRVEQVQRTEQVKQKSGWWNEVLPWIL